MICPYCGVNDDKVIDSRSSEGGFAVRRRRECLKCTKRFTTYERVEKAARLTVVKKDGSRVAFDRQSMMNGLQAACGKRPISDEVKRHLIQSVEDEVHREFDREVPSREIGQRIAARLIDVDEIAYFRFASEYYEMSSVEDVAKVLADLRARPRTLPNQAELFIQEK